MSPDLGWRARGAFAACAVLAGLAVFQADRPGSASVALIGVGAVCSAVVALWVVGVGRIGRAGATAVGALAGLVCWTALSLLWSIASDRTWDGLNLLLAGGAFLCVGIVFASALGGLAARGIAAVMCLVLGAAVGWSLLGVAIPALAAQGDRVARLQEPVGYWNALALLTASAVPLGGWVALRSDRVGRTTGGVLVYGAVVALLLTQSRAGLVAAVVCAIVWVLAQPERLAAALRLLGPAVAGIAVSGWAFTKPALVEDGAGRAARVDAGWQFAVVFVAVGLIVAAASMLAPVDRLVHERRRVIRYVIGLTMAATIAAGIAGLAVAAGNPFSWARDQASGGECANDPTRFGALCANNRLAWWEEAGNVFLDHPVLGTGAQSFVVARTRVREGGDDVSQPHSVPLQILSDLGLVGLALGATLASALGVAVVRSLRRLQTQERAAATAVACLPLAFGLHALVDFDADFLAVTGPVMLVGGVLAGAGRPASARRSSPAVLAAAGIAVAAVGSLLLPWLSQRAVDDVYQALGVGNREQAARAADRAHDLNPLSLDARRAQAAAAPDDDAALSYLTLATEQQPENARAWVERGRHQLDFLGDACGAYFSLNRAYTLDPHSKRWSPGGPLDRARAAVDDPANPACGRPGG